MSDQIPKALPHEVSYMEHGDDRPIALELVMNAANTIKNNIERDKLTGLLNKQAWKDLVNETLSGGGNYGIIFVDLTNFKAINDRSEGRHERGDEVLQDIARVLETSLRASDQGALAHETLYSSDEEEAGRLGGDEFALLVNLDNLQTDDNRKRRISELSPEECLMVVKNRVKGIFKQYIDNSPELAGFGFNVAVGGAVCEPGLSVTDVLLAADNDMHENKHQQHIVNGSYR